MSSGKFFWIQRERESERNENFGDDDNKEPFTVDLLPDFTARAMRLSDDYTSA